MLVIPTLGKWTEQDEERNSVDYVLKVSYTRDQVSENNPGKQKPNKKQKPSFCKNKFNLDTI